MMSCRTSRWVVVPFRRRVTAPRMTRRRGLRQEPRERGPRRAPAGGAGRGANFKALVAIETQGELPQREMHLRSKHSSTADHPRVTSGTGTGPSQPVVAAVTSVKSFRPMLVLALTGTPALARGGSGGGGGSAGGANGGGARGGPPTAPPRAAGPGTVPPRPGGSIAPVPLLGDLFGTPSLFPRLFSPLWC